MKFEDWHRIMEETEIEGIKIAFSIAISAIVILFALAIFMA